MDPLGPAGAGAPTAMLDAGAPVAATDASVGVDAAMQATPDAGSVGEGTDAAIERLGLAPAGPAPGVSCGVGLPVLCALDGEKCCARSLSTDTCIEASASCDCEFGDCMVMEAFCDGPEDCPMGQVCCGTLAGGSGYERFECAATCDYAGTQRIACHQEAPECPDGNECANSQLLTNVQVCIDPATIRQ